MEKTVADDKGRKIVSSEIIRRGLLLAVSSNIFGRSYILDRAEMILGRDASADLVIHDSQVSGRHCRILFDGRAFLLEDLDSTNGTYLNRKKITKSVTLGYGDRLVVGETILRFFYEEEL